MKYTLDWLGETARRYNSIPEGAGKRYTVEVDGGFGMPPMLDVVRMMGEIGAGGISDIAFDTQVSVLRKSIQGRKVTAYYDGRDLGSFVSNAPNDDFNNFPVLAQNPIVMVMLLNMALANVLGKSLPPQDAVQPPAAKTEGRAP